MKRITIYLLTTVLAINFLYAQDTNKVSQKNYSYLPDFTISAEKSVPAVVHVRTKVKKTGYMLDENADIFDFFFGNPSYRQFEKQMDFTSGSGVIISKDGYVVTNNHVINGADLVEIVLNDKRRFDAKVVGVDKQTDVALLKVEANDLPFISFGNSDVIKIGQWVLAIGNPLTLSTTVTAGIISAKARSLNTGQLSIESFIQTDAAVNAGNSGGALVNTNGELIGINTMIASRTGSYEGYSFAIPSNLVKKIVSDLIEFKEVQRGYLGVRLREIDAALAEEKNIPLEGVYVQEVDVNTAASEAGIKSGDVILKANGTKVNSSNELIEEIAKQRPGNKVDLNILRNSNKILVSVTLKDKFGRSNLTNSKNISIFGAVFTEINSSEKAQYKILYGIKALSVGDGIIKEAGINDNCVLIEANEIKLKTVEDLKKALSEKGKKIKLKGLYDSEYIYIFILNT